MNSNLLLGFGTLAFFFWLSRRDNVNTKMRLDTLINAVLDADRRFPNADTDIKRTAVRIAETVQRHAEEVIEHMQSVGDVPWLLSHIGKSGTDLLKRAQALHMLELRTVEAGMTKPGDDQIILATKNIVDFSFAEMEQTVKQYASLVPGEDGQISILKRSFTEYDHFRNDWRNEF